MSGPESIFLKVLISILKMVGIWWVLQKWNKTKLCRLFLELADNYANAPKEAEDTYATLIVLFRNPIIRETKEISLNFRKFYEIEEIRKIHAKCSGEFSSQQNAVINAVLDSAKRINENLQLIDLDREKAEQQKNFARQVLIDWCYIVFMLNKIGTNGSKFRPQNLDVGNFNQVIRERFGVVLDENQLFKNGLSKFGVKIVHAG